MEEATHTETEKIKASRLSEDLTYPTLAKEAVRMITNDGYRWICRCPFCDFLARPASLKGSYRRKSEEGAEQVRCPQCDLWYFQDEANRVEPLVAFLASAHRKLGFPNLTVDQLQRIVLFVRYEHHLLNCNGTRGEAWAAYYGDVRRLAKSEVLSEVERRSVRSEEGPAR